MKTIINKDLNMKDYHADLAKLYQAYKANDPARLKATKLDIANRYDNVTFWNMDDIAYGYVIKENKSKTA